MHLLFLDQAKKIIVYTTPLTSLHCYKDFFLNCDVLNAMAPAC